MALAVSHVVQNVSQPLSHRRHLLLFVLKALASPIAHRLTPTAGFNFVHTAVLWSHRQYAHRLQCVPFVHDAL